jgi:aspartyl-tRNA(Asn)/glutamyl-tRNA(Gln) amidotransferase subunit C
MKINIKHLAKLSNLALSASEEKIFEKQLTEILSYVEKLKVLDTKNVEATSQVTKLQNIFRKDLLDENRTLTQDDALLNAKNTHNGLIEIPANIKGWE